MNQDPFSLTISGVVYPSGAYGDNAPLVKQMQEDWGAAVGRYYDFSKGEMWLDRIEIDPDDDAHDGERVEFMLHRLAIDSQWGSNGTFSHIMDRVVFGSLGDPDVLAEHHTEIGVYPIGGISSPITAIGLVCDENSEWRNEHYLQHIVFHIERRLISITTAHDFNTGSVMVKRGAHTNQTFVHDRGTDTLQMGYDGVVLPIIIGSDALWSHRVYVNTLTLQGIETKGLHTVPPHAEPHETTSRSFQTSVLTGRDMIKEQLLDRAPIREDISRVARFRMDRYLQLLGLEAGNSQVIPIDNLPAADQRALWDMIERYRNSQDT